MNNYISSIEIRGLHGQFDYACSFQEGINVIYGRNGSGKTTLLHILANVLNEDYLRFAALNFHSIEVSFGNPVEPLLIELERIPHKTHYHGFIRVNGIRLHEKAFSPRDLDEFFGESSRRVVRERDLVERHLSEATISEKVQEKLPRIKLTAAYFPAFRTAIDAWAINVADDTFYREMRRRGLHQKTKFARSLFGRFVPNLDYPATSEIEDDLNYQIRTAIANVSRADRTYFGNVPSRILEALAEQDIPEADVDSILADIEDLSKKFQEYPIQVKSMWDKLSESVQSVPNDSSNQTVTKQVLNSYREALKRIVRVQENSFSSVEQYLSSVNAFLEGKNLEMASVSPGSQSRPLYRNTPSVVITHNNKSTPSVSMTKALSSGERQIATLIYAATRLNQQDVILIDEPEISLNVDWQRKLLPEMQKQMPSKQLIVCTHSPIVGARYRNAMIELNPVPTNHVETEFVDSEEDLDVFRDVD